jgi:hypothetical protein
MAVYGHITNHLRKVQDLELHVQVCLYNYAFYLLHANMYVALMNFTVK